MARAGSLGASLNPFGGASADFSQYNIRDTKAALEAYQAQVQWANGELSDTDYLAELQKELAAAKPNTTNYVSIQNTIHDTQYRIGRQAAQDKGLDALIAYDQQSLAAMTPDNQHYKDIADSLQSELASRRSRDWGKLVDAYNAGKSSTSSLLEYVGNLLKTLDPNAPDYDNWTSQQQTLEQRLQNEQDTKEAQDYQHGRVTGDQYIAYLTTRRDGYDPSSPDWASANNTLEDVTKQVATNKQNAADTRFFDLYEEGKKSDADYLGYIKTRLDGMDPADPDYETWRHRYAQVTFSIAEDQLRFDVAHGKKPVSDLVTFYRNYRATLNPGSAEWRQVTDSIDQLTNASSGGGGGGGGGGKGKAPLPGTGAGFVSTKGPVGAKLTTDLAIRLLAVDPHATSKAQKAALALFNLNYDSLQNAIQRGDPTWQFYDPRKPGTSVTLSTTSDALAAMDGMNADYHATLASMALARHDLKGYASEYDKAINAADHKRLTQATAVGYRLAADEKHTLAAIRAAEAAGDFATALNLGNQFIHDAAAALSDPILDQTRRKTIQGALDALGNDKLFAQDPNDPSRSLAVDQANSTRDPITGAFIDVVLAPGWHHTLDGPPGSAWGLTYDAAADPQAWAASHMTVTTSYGPDRITGEVTVRDGTPVPLQSTTADGGLLTAIVPAAKRASYTDEHGNPVRAYSIDGRTWVLATGGTTPVMQYQGSLTKTTDPKTGATSYVDAKGETVYTTNPDGSVAPVQSYFANNPGQFDWYRSGYFGNLGTSAAGFVEQRGDIAGGLYGTVGSYGAPGQILLSADADNDPTTGETGVDFSTPFQDLAYSPTREIAGGAYGDLTIRNPSQPSAVAQEQSRRGLVTAGGISPSLGASYLPPIVPPVVIPPPRQLQSGSSRADAGLIAPGPRVAPPPPKRSPVPDVLAQRNLAAAGVGPSLAGSTPTPTPPAVPKPPAPVRPGQKTRAF